MGKKYDIEEDKFIVDFCLNCNRRSCKGNCEELKKAKRQRKAEMKGRKNESDNKNG